jgi:hypothetical protein
MEDIARCRVPVFRISGLWHWDNECRVFQAELDEPSALVYGAKQATLDPDESNRLSRCSCTDGAVEAARKANAEDA